MHDMLYWIVAGRALYPAGLWPRLPLSLRPTPTLGTHLRLPVIPPQDGGWGVGGWIFLANIVLPLSHLWLF